jgi:transcriptional regulator with XRE-family HTH domain
MESVNKLLAKRIKALRQERGITQEELALKADINKSFMGEIERAVANPTVNTLEKISIALGVTIEDLFKFEYIKNDAISKELECLEKINFEIRTRSLKEQEAIYKLIKTFFSLVDKN